MTSRISLAIASLVANALLASSIQLKPDPSELIGANQMDALESDSVESISSNSMRERFIRNQKEAAKVQMDAVEGQLNSPDSGGCGRGFNCGIANGMTSEPMSVECPDGRKWFARNAIFIRGNKGANAIYCSVPKIGTSYMFGVFSDLHLAVRGGKRNAGFEAVHEIITANESSDIDALCKAYSFIVMRNPWERIASAYVDKVLTKEVFSIPPSFNNFMHMLAGVKEPGEINQHFRPASLTCQTSGEHSMNYDKKIKMEATLRDDLEGILINKLNLPGDHVKNVLDRWDEQTHSTKEGGRWENIDKSINSGKDRVSFYFGQSDPKLVEKVYKDDIAFGNYAYGKGHY